MYHYNRKVQYYETDKMGISHHANYVKWMEEARVSYLESVGLPFQEIEKRGIASPVVGISVDYKHPSTFGDNISIETSVCKYNGVKLEVSYIMKNADTNELIATAYSKHCFLKDEKIVSLKKEASDMHENLISALQEDCADK